MGMIEVFFLGIFIGLVAGAWAGHSDGFRQGRVAEQLRRKPSQHQE